MTNNQSLMQFPCDFPIKIIGENKDTFIHEITHILHKHYPDLSESAIRSQPSKQGNYIAISSTLHVLDQPSLDALYQELTKHPDIKMVL